MSVQQTGTVDIAGCDKKLAWQEFINLTALSADERTVGANRLRRYSTPHDRHG